MTLHATTAARLCRVALLGLLCVGGCEQARFGFESGRKFSLPGVEAGSRAAACFDDLASTDAGEQPDLEGLQQVALLGEMSQQAFRSRERRRQREWDQRYCRLQADCRALADPALAAVDISDTIELCLDHRSQRRVR